VGGSGTTGNRNSAEAINTRAVRWPPEGPNKIERQGIAPRKKGGSLARKKRRREAHKEIRKVLRGFNFERGLSGSTAGCSRQEEAKTTLFSIKMGECGLGKHIDHGRLLLKHLILKKKEQKS